MESEGESEPEQQPPKEKMGEKKLLNSRSSITSSSACHQPQPPQPSLSRQSLCRRVNAVVMGVIIPIGKQRKGLNRNRICFGGNGPSSDKLPRFVYYIWNSFVLSYFHKRQAQAAQVCVLFCFVLFPQTPGPSPGLMNLLLVNRKVSFVFTERDAMRKIVRQMMQDCPKMCIHGDREDFLMSLLELLDDELKNKPK